MYGHGAAIRNISPYMPPLKVRDNNGSCKSIYSTELDRTTYSNTDVGTPLDTYQR